MTTKTKLNISRDYYFSEKTILEISKKYKITFKQAEKIIKQYSLAPEREMIRKLKYKLAQKKPEMLIELTQGFSYLKVN